MRASPYRNYICREVPDDESVVYYLVIDTPENIDALYGELLQEECMNGFKIVVYPCVELPECSMLKIYNHNATKENMTDYLKNLVHAEKTITFGTIEGKYDHVIDSGDFNRVVKLMKNEYEPLWLKKIKN